MIQSFIYLAQPYLHLMRLHKPIGIGLLMLPCWWGVLAHRAELSTWEISALLGWFALGSVLMRSAGCIVNDLADRPIDAQVTRTASRPLASGVITSSSAKQLSVVLVACAALVALALGTDTLILSMLWLPLVIAYPFMKRITYWPQAFLGITFGAGALFGTMASIHHMTPVAWWLYVGSIFWVIGYDTIYACQDRADDARIGVKSTALRFGTHLRAGVAGCYMVTCVCWGIARILHSHAPILPIALFIVVVGLLFYQILKLNAYEQVPFQQLFTLNLWVGIVMCGVFI